jgi:pyruvate kinase
MNRTKIVCTVGPASASATKLKSMIRAGMDMARLNFSHGAQASHKKLLRLVRTTSKQIGKYVGVLGDLQGPKIRLGELPEAGVMLKPHETYLFSTAIEHYNGKEIPVTYKHLHRDVSVGHRFLIDDGLLELKITKIVKQNIHAVVMSGGLVTSHKGMNFPDLTLSVDPITQKDKEDIIFAVREEVDWLALSFATRADDVRRLRRLIKQAGKPGQILPRIIVKIEKREAIEQFEEILKETDGMMIARGDLGIEIPAEEVPVRQKEMIERCRASGKPVIVATQMLDSMIRNPRPTRAEISDVANAVFDHTDAVMLSGESANGKYPVEAVKIMTKIVREAEASAFDNVLTMETVLQDPVAAVAHSIKLAAEQGSINGVLVSIELAAWSESIHRAHPEIPLFIACQSDTSARQAALRWGSVPFVFKNAREATFAKRAIRFLLKEKQVKRGMRLAVVLGGRHGEAFDVVEV